jgi:hypothetical protein
VERGRTAKCDQRPRAQILAALDGVHARGIRHVLVHQLADAERRVIGFQPERRADPLDDGSFGGGAIERNFAAGESIWIDAAEHHVGVRHGRLRTALPVANRTRLRARAVRPHGDALERVEPRVGAAARADLHHLDHRNAQRQAAAFEKAVNPRHFQHTRGLRPRLVDQADFRRGAAHVERQHLIEPVLPGDAAGEYGARRRPRLDEAHRIANSGLDRGNPAARCHQQQRTGKAGALKLAFQSAEITSHQRLDVGVGAGGGETLVFAHLRRNIGRQRHRHVRQAARDRIAGAALVIGIGEAMEKADRDPLDPLRRKCVERAREAALVERHQHISLGIDPLAHRKAQAARHQRWRQVDVDVVLLEAVFVPDFDDVAETFGRQQRGLRALALDHRVGGERRAMDDEADLAWLNARRPDDRPQRRRHPLLRRTRRGERLRRKALLANLQRHVGERAADIETEPDCGGRCHAGIFNDWRSSSISADRTDGASPAKPACKNLMGSGRQRCKADNSHS